VTEASSDIVPPHTEGRAVTAAKRKLAAILAADAAGYSRLMATDERATIAALDAARAVFRGNVDAHQGRVIDTAGDSVLAVFDTASGAASAALAIQQELWSASQDVAEDRRMRFRIGVHLGDIIEKLDGTVYGDGVNIAARLHGLADPGGIVFSDAVRTSVRGKVVATFEDLGEQSVKNIAEPIRAFRVTAGVAAVDPTAMARAAVRMQAPVPGFGGRPAIAVLPFVNMSGELEHEYFADGLAEDILTRLAMWRWFPVIARNSSFTYKGRAVDVKEVGRALGARYVLEGSVRKAGNRVRVTAQLIDSETGHHLWADRYDRIIEDLFVIQDEVTDGIAAALEAAVGRAELERVRVKAPANLDAWEASQRGWWHAFQVTREDCVAAEPFFRRAMELDPALAQPATGIACLRLWEGLFLWAPPQEAFSASARYAQTALALDPVDSTACHVLGLILAFRGKLDEAVAMCRKSIALNPSNAHAYEALGVTHLFRGEAREGIQASERAIRTSPNDTLLGIFLDTLSVNHYMAGEYERAVEIAQLAVQRAPHFPIGWRNLANALGQLGRIEEAREALAEFLRLMPGYTTAAARPSVGFRDEALFQRYFEGLRKAGWEG
jgi:adenylate cyclase